MSKYIIWITFLSFHVIHAQAAPITQESKILFLGGEASAHQAEFAALYSADSTVTNLNLSFDSFVPASGYVQDDFFDGRNASTDKNALLNKLDEGFDYIVYIGNTGDQQNIPEVEMSTLMFLKRYLQGTGTEIVYPVLWNATDAATHTSTFQEHVYRIGDALGLEVVPAGLAWEAVLADGSLTVAQSNITSAPSTEATFTLATSLYSHFFEQNASSSTYLPTGMSGADKTAILTHSHSTYTNALTATHYTGDYWSPIFRIWPTPVDMSKKFVNAGWSQERRTLQYMQKLYYAAGSPVANRVEWWNYPLPDSLKHEYRLAEIESEDFAFTLTRHAYGSYSLFNDMQARDPGNDIVHYIIDQPSNPDHSWHGKNARASIEYWDAWAAHPIVEFVPTHTGFAWMFQNRPDINPYPLQDTVHVGDNGNAIHAGMIYTLLTGRNGALLTGSNDGGDLSTHERYGLNVSYDLIQSMSRLSSNYPQLPVEAHDQFISYAHDATSVDIDLDLIASAHKDVSVTLISPPSAGSLVQTDYRGSRYVYTPQMGNTDDVTFVYTATDGTVTTPETTVTLAYTGPALTVPASIQGVSPTGSGTDGDPYVYDFGGADLTMDFELFMDNNDQNTQFINVGNILSTTGGGVDSTWPQQSPDFKVNATGNIHLDYVDTQGIYKAQDAGEISLVTTGGNILVNRYLRAWAPNYGGAGGKPITLTAPGSITVGQDIDGNGKSEPITITGSSISIGTTSEGIANYSQGTDSGPITLHATAGDISIAGGIKSYTDNTSAFGSGPVSLTATGTVRVGGDIDLTSPDASKSDIIISGASIAIAGIDQCSLNDGQDGGDISLMATSGGITVSGDLTANGGFNHSSRIGGTIDLSANGGDIVLEGTVSSEATQDGDLILRATGDIFLGSGLDLNVLDAILRPGWDGNSGSPAYSGSGKILIDGPIANLDTGNVFYGADDLQGDVYFDSADNATLSDGASTGKGTVFKAMSVYEGGSWSDGVPTASRAGLVSTAQSYDSSGTLVVGELFVASGGNLAGNGTVDGNVTIHPGATLAPGTDTNTLSVSGDLLLRGSYLCEMNDAQTPKTDSVAVSGTLDLTDSVLNLQVSGSLTEPVYVIATYGSLVGNFATINNVPSGYYVDYNYSSGTAIAVKSVPAGVEIEGNSVRITPGDATPSSADHTDFGSTETYGSNLLRTFTLKNTGGSSVNVSGVTMSGPQASDFTVTTQPAGTVSAGSDTTFTITFTPSAAGMRTAIATIQVGSDYLPFTIQAFVTEPIIQVRGNSRVISSGDITPAREDFTNFGEVFETGGNLTRSFTIENVGDAAMTVSGVTITGPEASDYTLTSSPATSVAVGASTTFDITFDPSAVGFRDATVTVNSNDSVRGPQSFAITGQGFDPASQPYITKVTYIKKDTDTALTQMWDGNSWTGAYEIELIGYQVGYYDAPTGGSRILRQSVRMDRGGDFQSTSYLQTEGEPQGFSPASWQFVTGTNPTKMGASDFDNGGNGTASPANGFTPDDGVGVEEINWMLKAASNTAIGNAKVLAIGVIWYDDGDGLLEDSGNDRYVIKYALSADHPDGQAAAFAQMDSLLELNAAVGNLDSDFDGIEDAWEITHFGNLTDANATSDWDGDGSSDYTESKAGTLPKDDTSSFRTTMTGMDLSANELDISWPSASGRTYSVRGSHDLLGNWSMLQSNIPATPPTNQLTISTDPEEAVMFIRIEIE